MPDAILQTKIFPPPLRPSLVRRPRLLEKLRESLALRRLTLIAAPAGYGKTTLLRSWLAESEYTGAWLALDEADNDRVRFWRHFLASLAAAVPGFGAAPLAYLAGFSMLGGTRLGRGFPREALLVDLLNELAALASPVLMALDDFHLLAEPALLDDLAFFFERLPPTLHPVLAGRAEPPLPLARWRARGELGQIYRDDLCFTAEETAAFIRNAGGPNLSADEAAALASRAEGWAAGLQMAAISLAGQPEAAGFIRAFSGGNLYISAYLAEEVLARQREDVQSFLLCTSILDRLCGPLCEFLLAEEGEEEKETSSRFGAERTGQAMLEGLARANLFLHPLDDEGRWYRYHQLFADSLRERLLRQAGAHGIAALHRKASAWFEWHGLTGEAIEHALAAGDRERAANLIERAAENAIFSGELATLTRWLEALPAEALRSRPLLSVYQAAVLLLGSSSPDEIEALLEASCGHEPARVAGARTALRGMLASFQGDVVRGGELSRAALRILPPEDLVFRSLAAINLGTAAIMQGDVDEAGRAFEESAGFGRRAGNRVLTAMAQCQRAEVSIIEGMLGEAQARYEEVLARTLAGVAEPIAGMALIGLGDLARERNDLENAAAHLSRGIELAGAWTPLVAVDGYIALARVRQAQGDLEGARDSMRKARWCAAESGATKLDDLIVALYEARLALARGEPAAALRWARKRGFSVDTGPDFAVEENGPASYPFLREQEKITLARILLVQGRPGQALALLAPLLAAAEGGRRTANVLQILLLQALACAAQGREAQALEALARAIFLAEPEGYVRLFLDEGPPMARLLHQAAARGLAPDYLGRLLATFPVAGPPGKASGEAGTVEALSARELEVLRLLGCGLTNAEVAQALHLSLATVKWHTGNIYGKLGAENRARALMKARALGLLE